MRFADGEVVGVDVWAVAAKYHTDWMALWSLNGDASPDALGTGTSYRFAHEYIVQQGARASPATSDNRAATCR